MANAGLKMDPGVVTTIIGSIAAVVAGIAAGFWKWASDRRKTDIDAQASVMNGFVLLLGEVRSERTQLVARINDLESSNHKLDRHILNLERLMTQHDIDIPPDGHSEET